MTDSTPEENKRAIGSRMAELSLMQDGWYYVGFASESLAPTAVAVVRAHAILSNLMDYGISRPAIYPTPEGGIQADWENTEIQFCADGSITVLREIDVFASDPHFDFVEIPADTTSEGIVRRLLELWKDAPTDPEGAPYES